MADNNDGDIVVDHPFVDNPSKSYFPPLFASWNEKICPILETIDKLRSLNVIKEGIHLPTIVVAGDNDSGKSSVIESLIGITLPCAPKICTRVPLIIKLQNHANSVPEFLLEYQKKSVRIMKEMLISKAINKATVEVAGEGKRITNVPLTLVVKKKGIPDLTIIDLPGICSDWMYADRDDILKQISSGITTEYIKPKDIIILNVASAGGGLSNWKSLSMSQSLDKTEERTLAVITKCDLIWGSDYFKTAVANIFSIRHPYIFVINRINDETYNHEARIREAKIFDGLRFSSKSEKSTVGIPALANRILQIQLLTISKCLPEVVKNINERLNDLNLELNRLPNNSLSIPDAMAAFMHILGSLKETLQKILIGGEYNEYADDRQIHCDDRLVEMLDEFSKKLHSSVKFSESFLVEEIQVIEETNNGILLSHLPPHSLLLRRKVNNIYNLPLGFVKEVWGYLEIVCDRVLIDHYGNYPQLLSSMRKATHNVMEKMKFEFLERVVEMMEMEKATDYTSDPDFIASWHKLMDNRDEFMKAVCNYQEEINMEAHGTINVKHLFSVQDNTRDQAFELKMRMTAYWKIVLKRLVDWIVLGLRFMIKKMVIREIEMEIVNEVMVHGGGIEKISEELSPERVNLQTTVGLVQKSKEFLEQVMDDIFISVD
ncbi:unnamed protein product [Lactuca virosa]|uniref:Dynamin-type G domain-containing protein n=1 Tax=Lactuca virosa TaxID=75947 RepID=A0AAU9P416_9ASTR|nr:unnamed protein product [Lactuca virosa]